MAVPDRKRGALFGLAVGDAMGACVEFRAPGAFEPVTGYRAGGPFDLEAGEWTDDTSMALALADSLARGWDLNDQARRYLSWWQTGKYSVNGVCFDIGGTTLSGLSTFAKTGNATVSGSLIGQGNGSIMRLSPVSIRYSSLVGTDPARLADLADASSAVTHATAECRHAARVLALILAGLIEGHPRELVLAPQGPILSAALANADIPLAIAQVAQGSYRNNNPPDIRGSGHVVKSLEAALWAFHDAPDFASAVLKAVNLGEDSDTTGAVAGQLAGACFGESGIPTGWLAGLARKDMIEEVLAPILGPSV